MFTNFADSHQGHQPSGAARVFWTKTATARAARHAAATAASRGHRPSCLWRINGHRHRRWPLGLRVKPGTAMPWTISQVTSHQFYRWYGYHVMLILIIRICLFTQNPNKNNWPVTFLKPILKQCLLAVPWGLWKHLQANNSVNRLVSRWLIWLQ